MSKTLAGTSATGGSRGELLDWVNTLLGTHYSKVEETSNGAAFCQIMDALVPGKVKLHKVNYNAVTEPEMVANYKVLQEVLNAEEISRNIPVESLTKGKCMAALEMLQWIKKYFDQHFTGGDYDGSARRTEVGIREPGDNAKGNRKVVISATGTVGPKTPRVGTARAVHPAPATTVKTKALAQVVPPSQTPGNKPNPQLKKLKEEVAELTKENGTLLEERNFYYEKLQRVEVMCQTRESDDFAARVLAVLYETDEGRGFLSPDELDI